MTPNPYLHAAPKSPTPRDHQQWLARQQTGMLTSESRFRKLEKRIKTFERWMARARKQLAAIWDRLRGRQA